jgi:uncharacterized protein (TIGR04255 family)
VKYPKPPITEAALELRFVGSISQTAAEGGARRFEGRYPQKEKEETTQIMIDTKNRGQEVVPTWTWLGVKLHSNDRADVLVLRRQGFVCARLAPYLGWEDFRAKAQAGWETFKKSIGSQEIARIGVRYINRIDIPDKENGLINIDEYLNVVPKTPDILQEPMTSYMLRASRPIGNDNCNVTITSSTVASPLINFLSLALDIDLYTEKDIPRREDELWALIDLMREHKNRIFEASITDKARALFQ